MIIWNDLWNHILHFAENFSRATNLQMLNPSEVIQPHCGDNLQILREHIAVGSFNLIYLDPPRGQLLAIKRSSSQTQPAEYPDHKPQNL
jgi:16S rRNA G966 N2-methylase RsmD